MKISPFRAVRPVPEEAARFAALPYDVFSEAEAREAVSKDPLTFLSADRPETAFPEGQDMYAPEVYEKAAELLHNWLSEGILLREAAPCYYLYELTMDGRCQRGLVCVSDVDDYLSGAIKRHENTRRDKEEDRVRHIDVTSMQTGPIFLAYRQQADLKALVDEAEKQETLYDFVSPDGIRHKLIRISRPELISAVTEAFLKVPNTYIADGHHRAASAVRVCEMRRKAHPGFDGSEEFNRFLTVLFPDEELKILDYNRLVKIPEGMDEKEILDRIGAYFEIAPETAESGGPEDVTDPTEIRKTGRNEQKRKIRKPEQKGEILLFLKGKRYRMKAREEILSDDPVDGLDVSLLQRYILEPVFGIQDPKTDERIDFVGGIRPVSELEERSINENSAAFVMYPTSLQELFAAADKGELMPPKSTWFEPKLRSGLFMHEMER
ncbi:MAG: DUF1015 domain-containing protein [Lachnospiraceae bacterium]|nr:DUF1015 domain-containing protein [Lachnospiraceae bacterium]